MIIYDYHTAQGSVILNYFRKRNIEFEIEEDIDKIIGLGITQVPIVKIGEKYYDFFRQKEEIKREIEK